MCFSRHFTPGIYKSSLKPIDTTRRKGTIPDEPMQERGVGVGIQGPGIDLDSKEESVEIY